MHEDRYDAQEEPLDVEDSSYELAARYLTGLIQPGLLDSEIRHVHVGSPDVISEGFRRDGSVTHIVVGDEEGSATREIVLVSGHKGTPGEGVRTIFDDGARLYVPLARRIAAKNPGVRVSVYLLGEGVTAEPYDPRDEAGRINDTAVMADIRANNDRVAAVIAERVAGFMDRGGRSVGVMAVSAGTQAGIKGVLDGVRGREIDEPPRAVAIVPNIHLGDGVSLEPSYTEMAAELGEMYFVLAEHDRIFPAESIGGAVSTRELVRAVGRTLLRTFFSIDPRADRGRFGAHQFTAVNLFRNPLQALHHLRLV